MSAIFDIELQDAGLLQRDETSEDESSDVIEIGAVKDPLSKMLFPCATFLIRFLRIVLNALAEAHVNVSNVACFLS